MVAGNGEMPSEPAGSSATETKSSGRSLRWAPWVIAIGGLSVALGTVITGATHWDLVELNGGIIGPIPQAIVYTYIVTLEATLTTIGYLLWGAGFLAVMVGVALATRVSPMHDPAGLSRRTLAVAVVGGALVAAGFVALAVVVLWGASYTPFPFGPIAFYALDLAGRIVEAVGFFLAFLALALGLRPRA